MSRAARPCRSERNGYEGTVFAPVEGKDHADENKTTHDTQRIDADRFADLRRQLSSCAQRRARVCALPCV